jgi:hypothetical protein
MHVHVEAMNLGSDNTRRVTPYVTHVRTEHAGRIFIKQRNLPQECANLQTQKVRYVIRILEQQGDEGRGLSPAREYHWRQRVVDSDKYNSPL